MTEENRYLNKAIRQSIVMHYKCNFFIICGLCSERWEVIGWDYYNIGLPKLNNNSIHKLPKLNNNSIHNSLECMRYFVVAIFVSMVTRQKSSFGVKTICRYDTI